MSASFRLVHFDLDGTLIDSGEDLAASTNHVRRSFGLEPLETGAILDLVGKGARVLVEKALGLERSDLFEEGIRRFLEHYEVHCLDRTKPFPGMESLVTRLRADGILVSVVTNKSEALARKVLDGLGLLEPFVEIVGGDTFPERKPDPAGVRAIQARTGVDPSASVMVGDSPVDVRTAENAGIRSIGVVWGLDPLGVREAEPDFLVTSVDELETVLRNGAGAGPEAAARPKLG